MTMLGFGLTWLTPRSGWDENGSSAWIRGMPAEVVLAVPAV